MSSVTEELLGFVDLVSMMLAAQEAFFASRELSDKGRWIKLKTQVEEVSRDVHRQYRGEQQEMFNVR